MKTKFILIVMLITPIFMSLISCTDKKGEELRDFYLSQARDESLVNIWKSEISNGRYIQYLADGKMLRFVKNEQGELVDDSRSEYWYTKGDILMELHYTGNYLTPSYENSIQYKIEDDKLYLKESEEFYLSGIIYKK